MGFSNQPPWGGRIEGLRASCTNADQIFDHDQPIRIEMKCILRLTQSNADWLQRATASIPECNSSQFESADRDQIFARR